MKFDDQGSDVQRQGEEKVDRNQGAARAISSFIDPGLSWKDIPWFQSITKSTRKASQEAVIKLTDGALCT